MSMTMRTIGSWAAAAILTLSATACLAPDDDAGALEEAATTAPYVFVVTLENHDATQIYGSAAAPYINNTLLPASAHATAFHDQLPASVPSEPHYVWMEAGTNVFADHTFSTDLPPGWFWNTTSSKAHLSTQLDAAGVSWMSYQEGLNASTGACPINDNGFYAAKHDPFIFFQDVSGSTPSASNPYCAAHHRALTALSADLASGAVAHYAFITPNLCHDMHGAWFCGNSNDVTAGDTWLHDNLPALISFVNAHDGVIFLVWDEGEGTTTMPFLAIGPHVKPGYAGAVSYDHSSLLKTVEHLLGVPTLPTVASANDLGDLFVGGKLP
jgi:phosphatidylinositol-3-phosphatase